MNALLLVIGSIFLRKKIDTQKEVSSESMSVTGQNGGSYPDDNFFLFSPPEFSLVGHYWDIHF